VVVRLINLAGSSKRKVVDVYWSFPGEFYPEALSRSSIQKFYPEVLPGSKCAL
jgi:hypothetical protein